MTKYSSKWDSNELAKWIEGLTWDSSSKSNLLELVKENRLTGSDLVDLKNPKEVETELGCDKITANALYQLINIFNKDASNWSPSDLGLVIESMNLFDDANNLRKNIANYVRQNGIRANELRKWSGDDFKKRVNIEKGVLQCNRLVRYIDQLFINNKEKEDEGDEGKETFGEQTLLKEQASLKEQSLKEQSLKEQELKLKEQLLKEQALKEQAKEKSAKEDEAKRKARLKELAERADTQYTFDSNVVSKRFNPIIRTPTGNGVQLKTPVTPDTSVRELRQIVGDEIIQDGQKLTLTYGAQVLVDSNKLSFYSITNNQCVIMTAIKVQGGATLPTTTKKERSLNLKNPLVRVTNKPDCVTYDDDEDHPRAAMPCGHAVTAQTMFDWLTTLFQKNEKTTDVCCPLTNCKKLWDWNLVVAVANLTPEENTRYTLERDRRKNTNTNVKHCPNCKSSIVRPDDLTMFRIRCTACSGGDFCFVCCKPWRGSGLQICGNSSCSGEYLNNVLQQCPMKKPSGWEEDRSNALIPSVRACPKCLNLIEHAEKCKHMTCPNCKADFCFACLGIKTAEGWPCNSHTYVCPIAPKQKLT